jgi:hypothetical protein
LGAGTADYDFSSDASIEDGEPWDRINDYRVSVPVSPSHPVFKAIASHTLTPSLATLHWNSCF